MATLTKEQAKRVVAFKKLSASKRSAAKSSGPPPSTERKSLPINAEYEARAKDLLRSMIAESGGDYLTLCAKLNKLGVEISPGGLENKISRGGFTAAFLLQCVDALKLKIAVSSK